MKSHYRNILEFRLGFFLTLSALESLISKFSIFFFKDKKECISVKSYEIINLL